jgi:hypothetical protein
VTGDSGGPKRPPTEPGNDLPPTSGEIDTGWDEPDLPSASRRSKPAPIAAEPEPEPGVIASAPPPTSGPVAQPELQPEPYDPDAYMEPDYAYDPSAAPPPDDETILPPAYSDTDLHTAVAETPADASGEPPPPKKRRRKRDDDDGDDTAEPRGSRTILIVGLSIVFGLTVATLALLGRANAGRYVIACSSDKIVAEQGRIFPPWGSRPIGGDEWKPITIPANAECKPRETDDLDTLAKWYLDELVDQASTLLTAHEVTKVDVAAEQLNQALLLARAPERREQRKDIERLLGDVEYWRASAKLRDAATSLADAAKQFDAAAQQRPRHVSDASAWASYIRKLVDELHTGPGGTVPAISSQPTERPTAPPGTALPVETGSGAGSATPIPAPDAGVATGGVLL